MSPWIGEDSAVGGVVPPADERRRSLLSQPLLRRGRVPLVVERHSDVTVSENPRPDLLRNIRRQTDPHLPERILRDLDGILVLEDGFGRRGDVPHVVTCGQTVFPMFVPSLSW